MGDAQPARIAKYLLRGYCLLNEYCPVGQNVPLVRSRSGTLVCVCDDPACPHRDRDAAPAVAAPTLVPEGTPAAAATFAGGGSHGKTPAQAAAAASPRAAPAAASARASSANGFATAVGDVEVTVQGPELFFNCARFAAPSAAVRGANPRLLGGAYGVRLRIHSTGVLPDLVALRALAASECRSWHECVLVPGAAGNSLRVSRAGGQLTAVGADGARWDFPEADCFVLEDAASVSAEVLAGRLADRLAGGASGGSGESTLRVILVEGGQEVVVVRRSLG